MQVSLEEIRELRQKLHESKAHHSALLMHARILREHCQEIRRACRERAEGMAAVVAKSIEQDFESVGSTGIKAK